jgi:hypothetical protein
MPVRAAGTHLRVRGAVSSRQIGLYGRLTILSPLPTRGH